jgi:hypothetical protein
MGVRYRGCRGPQCPGSHADVGGAGVGLTQALSKAPSMACMHVEAFTVPNVNSVCNTAIEMLVERHGYI